MHFARQSLKKITILLLATFSPIAAFAQNPPPPDQGLGTGSPSALRQSIMGTIDKVSHNAGLGTGSPTNLSPLDLFGLYLGMLLGFAGVVFVVQIIHGGYLWMTASGNDEQVRKARSKIMNGAIGAAIIFGAYIVAAFVLTLVTGPQGVNVPNAGGFPQG